MNRAVYKNTHTFSSDKYDEQKYNENTYGTKIYRLDTVVV